MRIHVGKRLRCAAAIGLAALLLAACGQPSDPYQKNGYGISGKFPDLAYTLTSETGEAVQADDLAGKLRLLYFGYTSCPDACPLTLARLSQAVSLLPKKMQDEVRILFVSVDPKRDSPAALLEYTDHFGPRVIGLTGTQEQLKTLVQRYNLKYDYGETDETGFYPVFHASSVYVFDPDGEARMLFTSQQTAEQIAADIKHLLTA